MSNPVETLKDLRDRVLAGEEVPQKELAAGLSALRQDREAASAKKAVVTEKKAKAAAKIPMDLNDLFSKGK